MEIRDNLLEPGERTTLRLRALYSENGYTPYRMSKFEEYDLYAGNKDFLVSDNVITFTDTDGKLMALKPDVTLSIIKNSRDLPDQTRKVYYVENVYRTAKGVGGFREILQTGLECFGKVTEEDLCQVLRMAAESVQLLGRSGTLVVSDLTLVSEILSRLVLPRQETQALYTAISQKNIHAIRQLCPDPTAAGLLQQLLSVHGKPSQAAPVLRALLPGNTECESFLRLLEQVEATPAGQLLRVDFSVMGDVSYYNGIVFKGFLSGIPDPVLSGGQYDRLMQKLHRTSRAIGFAVYTGELERLDQGKGDGWLNVALPKGRLGEKVYAMFAAAGFPCPGILESGRKLIFENPEKRVRYFWVKPSDVAIYVARGAADMGVAGKDILLEYRPEVYELLDLRMGKCRMAVAGPKGFRDTGTGTLRVATKFAEIARNFYRGRGRDIDIIHLNGSIELAPILGLSDVIVDIVETGSTLRENNLEVLEEVVPISARLIAGKSSFQFKQVQIGEVTRCLSKIVEEAK